jgi:hypothetical protein
VNAPAPPPPSPPPPPTPTPNGGDSSGGGGGGVLDFWVLLGLGGLTVTRVLRSGGGPPIGLSGLGFTLR